MKEILRVGLTGGIACGKSTVAAAFKGLGVPVVDADQLARRVVEPGCPALLEIVDRFGPTVLDAEGRLDRVALGQIVFNDSEARGAKRSLEAITHPRIAAEAAREFSRFAAAGEELVIYEAALLVEVGLAKHFDYLIVVAAQPETQIARLRLREGLEEEGARARLAAQMSNEEKVKYADSVIWNDGNQEQLQAAVEELYRKILHKIHH